MACVGRPSVRTKRPAQARRSKTLQWLRVNGLYSVPRNIKEEIGGLIYNSDRGRSSDDMEAFDTSRAVCQCNVGPPGLGWGPFTPMPMSCRLSREFCADVP